MNELCNTCNSANSNNFAIGQCAICNNKLDGIDAMVADAVKKLSETDCRTFSISTKMPEAWLIKEEALWDRNFSKCETIKGFVNRTIFTKIAKTSDRTYNAENGECRLVIDLDNAKTGIENEPLFVFGRYQKYSRELSQSRWICRKCGGDGCFKCDYTGKNYTSVEELIGGHFKTAYECDDYVLHASGREDVDVVNTAGRPFVLELVNPKKRNIALDEMAAKVNNDNIAVFDLKFVRRSTVELVANSHFDKAYEAIIEFEKEVTAQDMEKIRAITGKTIEQRTPTRVAHRRADLIRKRKILSINVIDHNKKNATITIEAEAGTYIKEFISGDKEKTKPSIGEIIGSKAKCSELRVVAIYDDFLKIRGL